VKSKRHLWLTVVFLAVFAITRWPGLMPPNFSAVYALMFCAGVFFRDRIAWWLPLVVVAATDVVLSFAFYHVNPFQPYQLMNYAAYAVLIWLGRRFDAKKSMAMLVGGAVLGAILFYIITNTAAWLFNPFGNPEYTKTLAGWLIALTKGAGNWPQTWEFFRNSLLSSGLFTALFAAAFKYSAHLESAQEKKDAEATATPDDADDTAEGESKGEPEKAGA
jgi:hypothetical protein